MRTNSKRRHKRSIRRNVFPWNFSWINIYNGYYSDNLLQTDFRRVRRQRTVQDNAECRYEPCRSKTLHAFTNYDSFLYAAYYGRYSRCIRISYCKANFNYLYYRMLCCFYNYLCCYLFSHSQNLLSYCKHT